mgnify:CR=1 FL=1
MNWKELTSSGLLAGIFVLAFGGQPHVRGAEANAAPQVNVILWFDTEDYLLPADDDASKRLAELLTERGIKATFKIVGEKARVLEQRDRRDVIAALQKHDIGYHANFHSVHPTPSEYLAECGLLDGVAEFVRREGGGAADVRRIFAVPTLSCYGQPGSSWGAQTIVGLKQIGVAPHGVPCYVDEGTHVGLEGKPFWYAGGLVVYDMKANWTRMELHNPAAVVPGKEKVTAIAERLRNEGGGLISIFYHPCEWVHREFWDGVNFRRGANPPRLKMKPPPQSTPEETEAAFQRFAEYIDHIRALPNVRFVTASDLPMLYPDVSRTQGASEEDLQEIVHRIQRNRTTGVDYQVIGRRAYSVADQFELLTIAVTELNAGRKPQWPLRLKGLLGPDGPPPSSTNEAALVLDRFAFRDAALDGRRFLETHGRVPARVFVGAQPVPPTVFLVAQAEAYEYHQSHGEFALGLEIKPTANVELLPARHVAKDTPDLFGGWVIHPAGFRAPKILEVARLQAWTLKPALR